MSTTAIIPLLLRSEDYPLSLNPAEFWQAWPALAYNISKIVGGEDKLYRLPILEFADTFTPSKGVPVKYWCYNSPKKLNTSIVIAVDDFGDMGKIAILYRIKSIAKPKSRFTGCLGLARNKEVKVLIFSIKETCAFFSEAILESRLSRVFGVEKLKQVLQAKTLFNGESYNKTSCLGCISFYGPAKVMLD